MKTIVISAAIALLAAACASTNSNGTASGTSTYGSAYGAGSTTDTTSGSGANNTYGTGSSNVVTSGSNYGSSGTNTNGAYGAGSTTDTTSGSGANNTYGTGSTNDTTRSGNTTTGSDNSGSMASGYGNGSGTISGQTGSRWGTSNYYGGTGYGSGGRYIDFTVFANWANFQNGGNINGTTATGSLGTSFRNSNGYGIGVNAFMGRALSLDLSASRIEPSARFTPANGSAFAPARVRMTPITAALAWHFFPNGSIDPYLGAGGAYVMFNNSNFTTANNGITGIGFRDRSGAMAEGGVLFGLNRNFGVTVDAKYMWLRGSGNAQFAGGTTGGLSNFTLNPFIVSAGLRFGF
jgi:outer membrane protein W